MESREVSTVQELGIQNDTTGKNRRGREREMTITRHPAGVEISAIIGGYRVSELFIGYTVREARAIFKSKHGLA